MKKQILYFHTNLSSFVKKDIEILEKKFIVKQFLFNASSKALLPFVFAKQKLFLLLNVFNASLIVCQFGGYHSFLPVLFAKIFNKRSLIITGGVDCVSYPSFNYGYLHKFPLGLFTKWSYRLANHIAPKHDSLMMSEDNYYSVDFPKQGIKYFIPGLKTPFTAIHNGYDAEKWKRISPKKKNTFITICGGWEYSFQQQLKGIDLIFAVAKFFQECQFLIVGVPLASSEGTENKPPSSNIKFIPPQKNENLVNFYSEAEFYLQLSISEGFPNALCEAMLCECIPIVSDVGAMPEIIGDSGFILKKRDIDLLKKIIGEAMICDKETLSKKAKKRIEENYTLEKREKKLLALSQSLIK